MKYIVFQTKDGLELPIAFPEMLVHKDVADRLHSIPVLCRVVIVSGGFTSIGPYGPMCHGESVSLNVKSRGAIDDLLMRYVV